MPAAKAAPQAVNKEAATISGASTVAKRIPAPQVRSGFVARCVHQFRPLPLDILADRGSNK